MVEAATASVLDVLARKCTRVQRVQLHEARDVARQINLTDLRDAGAVEFGAVMMVPSRP